MLSKFNLWVRIPLLFAYFALLSLLTAGTPVAFEFGNWLVGSAIFAVGSMALGIGYAFVMSRACDALGISIETRAKSGFTFSAINVVFLTLVFVLVAGFLPALLTIGSLWAPLVAASGYHVLLAVTLTRK